jgi:hypothetical protein
MGVAARVRKRQLPPADRDWQWDSGLAQRKAHAVPRRAATVAWQRPRSGEAAPARSADADGAVHTSQYQDRHSRQVSTSELARVGQNVGRDLLGTRKPAHSRQLEHVQPSPIQEGFSIEAKHASPPSRSGRRKTWRGLTARICGIA